MSLFFGLLLLIGIAFLVNRLTKRREIKNEGKSFSSLDPSAQIEVGYPAINSKSLHINSSAEPPLPSHHFTDKELNRFKGEDYNDSNKGNIGTKNMFIESHYALGISLFEKELNAQMVTNAYEKVLNNHFDNIRNGIPEDFNLKDKKEARDYLLAIVNKDITDS